jgi:hypothetical protein
MTPGWINVKDTSAKGTSAKGDGVTDDWEAIKNAIDMLAPAGAVLFFPPGVYLSSGPVYIVNKRDFVVLGYGATIQIDAKRPYARNAPNYDLSHFPEAYRTDGFSVLEVFNCSDFQVLGLRLHGNYVARRAALGENGAPKNWEWDSGIYLSGCHRFTVQSVKIEYCQGDGITLSPMNNLSAKDDQGNAIFPGARMPESNCSEFELRDVNVHNVARASIVVGGATNGILDGLIDWEIGWDEDHSVGSNAGIHFEVDGGEDYAVCERITITNVRCRDHGINQGTLLHLSRKARSISMTNFVFEQAQVPKPQAIRPASNGWTIVEIGADHRPDTSLPPEPAIAHDITLSNGSIRIDRSVLPHLYSKGQYCTGINLETGFIPNTDGNSKTGAFDKANRPQNALRGDAIFVQEITGPALNILDKDGNWVPFPTSGVNWTSPYDIAIEGVVIDGADVGILVGRNASDVRIENNVVRNTSKYSLKLLGQCTVVANQLLDVVGRDEGIVPGIYDRNGANASAFIRVGDQASSWDDPLPITDTISCENNIMHYGIADAQAPAFPKGLMYFSLDSRVTGFSANRNQCEGLYELDWNIFNGTPRSFRENAFRGNAKFGNFGDDGFSGELRWERQAVNGSIGNKNITEFANLVVFPKNVEAAKLVRDHGLYVLSTLPHRMILVTTIDQFNGATGDEVFGYLLG